MAEAMAEVSEVIKVNFATEEELQRVPGIGSKSARAIITMRNSRGSLTRSVLEHLLRRSLDDEIVDKLDFTPNHDLPFSMEEYFSPVPSPVQQDSDREAEDSIRQDRLLHDLMKQESDEDIDWSKPAPSAANWSAVRKVLKVAKEMVRATPAGSGGEPLSQKAKPLSLGARPKTTPAPRAADSSDDDSNDDSSDATTLPAKRKVAKSTKKSHTASFIRGLPKTLQYDGKGNWLAFKHKFLRYAKACDWTTDECLDGLCWCLTGKAADFHAIIMERKEKISYRKLLDKLEHRFGARELAETAQARFQQSFQNQGESLDDWADRVMTLATRAFKDLPEHYSNRQAVIKFCEGLTDKDAGLAVALDKPSTMEQAMNKIRWFQHLHQSVYGRSKKRTSKETADDSASVRAVQGTSSEGAQAKATPSQTSSLEAAIDKLQKSFDRMVLKLDEKAKTSDSQSWKRPNPSNGRKKRGMGPCYKCGKRGHFKQDCPLLQQNPRSDLNEKGSGQ